MDGKTTSRWKNRLSDKCRSLNLIDDVKQEARNASDKKVYSKLLATRSTPLNFMGWS